MIDLFWDAPSEWNGDMLGFLVQCNATGGEEAKTVMGEGCQKLLITHIQLRMPISLHDIQGLTFSPPHQDECRV